MIPRVASVLCLLATPLLAFATGLWINRVGSDAEVVLGGTAALVLCGWSQFIMRWRLAAHLMMTTATAAFLLAGMATSDCGSGSSGGGELCVIEPCRLTLDKLELMEQVGCVQSVPGPAGRLELALRCADLRPLRSQCRP